MDLLYVKLWIWVIFIFIDFFEKAFAKRHAKMEDRLNHGSKALPPLALGDSVTVQDQKDPRKPGRWTTTGEIFFPE